MEYGLYSRLGPIAEAYLRVVNEDASSRNRHYGREYTRKNAPELMGKTLPGGRRISEWDVEKDVASVCKNAMSMANSKFMQGATRLYLDAVRNRPREVTKEMNRLNQILKILSTAHANEYDRDLNGMTFEELDRRFSRAVSADVESEMAEISSVERTRNEGYSIVRIDSFRQAEEYRGYVSWCVTRDESMYDTYTSGGLCRFYQPHALKTHQVVCEANNCHLQWVG